MKDEKRLDFIKLPIPQHAAAQRLRREALKKAGSCEYERRNHVFPNLCDLPERHLFMDVQDDHNVCTC